MGEEYEDTKGQHPVFRGGNSPITKCLSPEALMQLTMEPYETVDHPEHYNQIPGIECIDVIEHFNFNLGAVIKHIWRAGLKPRVDKLEDLKKATWYLEREIERLELEKIPNAS